MNPRYGRWSMELGEGDQLVLGIDHLPDRGVPGGLPSSNDSLDGFPSHLARPGQGRVVGRGAGPEDFTVASQHLIAAR
jgi:hypothetical protein